MATCLFEYLLINTNRIRIYKMNKKNDNVITFLQVVSAFSVIALHTNSCFWNFDANAGYWFSANIIESVFYFAVPVFFMISGITLIDYQEKYSTKVFFLKRAKKTLLPYIIWSCIGIFYNLHVGYFSIDTLGIRTVLNGILGGSEIISVYWFFPCLFCVYLAIPLFAAVDKEKKKEIYRYIILIGIVLNTLIPFINNVFQLQIEWSYTISVASGYILWVVIGYVIYKYPMKTFYKVFIGVAGIIGLFMHICGTYILSIRDGSVNQTFKGYNNLPCIMYSCGIFILLCFIGKKFMKYKVSQAIVGTIGKYTFPIYLMHWFILDYVVRHFDVDTTSLLWRLGAPIPIGLVIVGITWIIRKIPILRQIVP